MKKAAIIISTLLLSLTTFSQKRIIKEYNNNNYEKCLALCNKEITKNSKVKQTAYLYNALILSKTDNKQAQAVDFLYRLRSSRDFTEFYKENKSKFYEVQNSIIAHTDTSLNISKHLLILKRLADLYLYEFDFSKSKGSGNYKNQSKKTNEFAQYTKYRILLKYTKILDRDIPSYKDSKLKELIFLYMILGAAKPVDDFKAVYNEIYSYVQNKNKKLLPALKEFSIKYAKKDDFEYRAIGNPKLLKKTIDFEKVKLHVDAFSLKQKNSVKKLSKYLSSDLIDAEKVYAIYYWIEKNIKYVDDTTSEASVNTVMKQSDYDSIMVRTTQSADYVLKKKQAVCEGYANLFFALCKEANVETEHVSGYSAGMSSVVGSHAWNIVKIKEKWYLIDVTWGEEENFLSDPVKFNEKHYAEKNKQLLFAPYSRSYFLKNAKKYAISKNANKKDSASLFKLAFVYYKNNESKKAVETFLEFSKNYTKSFDYHYYLAYSYRQLYDYDNALVQMKKAIKIKPNNISMLLSISAIYKSKYNFNEAYKYINIAKKYAPKKARIYRNEAFLLHKMKEYDKAIKIADSLVLHQAKDIQNLELRAFLYTYNNKPKKGIVDCEAILKRDAENVSGLSYISQCWQNLQEYDKALLYISKLLKKYPNNTTYLGQKAFVHFLMKDYEKAYKIVKEQVEKKPLNQYNISNLAWYCVLTKRYDDAIMYAHASIKINKNTGVWNSLALAYIYTNQYSEAEKIYKDFNNKKYQVSTSYNTYNDFFLKWIKYLEDNNMGHKDFAKVKVILE